MVQPAWSGNNELYVQRDMAQIATVSAGELLEPGEIVLSARMFGDIVRKMPGETVTIRADEKYNTVIRGDVTEFTIMGMTAADYPEIPKVDDGASFTLPQPVLGLCSRKSSTRWHGAV